MRKKEQEPFGSHVHPRSSLTGTAGFRSAARQGPEFLLKSALYEDSSGYISSFKQLPLQSWI